MAICVYELVQARLYNVIRRCGYNNVLFSAFRLKNARDLAGGRSQHYNATGGAVVRNVIIHSFSIHSFICNMFSKILFDSTNGTLGSISESGKRPEK